jgi:hypothetical protein
MSNRLIGIGEWKFSLTIFLNGSRKRHAMGGGMENRADVKDFVLKEYESLRSEIRELVADSRAVERNAVIATTAIWTWLLVQPEAAPWSAMAKWLPTVFCALSALRSWMLLLAIHRIAQYLRQVEDAWGSDLGFKWEHFIQSKSWYIAVSALLLWAVLLIGNILVANRYDSGMCLST